MFNDTLLQHGIGAGGSNVKSLQRGGVLLAKGSTPINISISAVDLSKSIVLLSHSMGSSGQRGVKGVLTSPTNLQLNIHDASPDSNYYTIYWTVVEFNNVKSLQTGTFSLTTTDKQQVSIATIDPYKSLIFTSETSDYTLDRPYAGASIINENTIEFYQMYANTKSIYWQVIEFK